MDKVLAIRKTLDYFEKLEVSICFAAIIWPVTLVDKKKTSTKPI